MFAAIIIVFVFTLNTITRPGVVVHRQDVEASTQSMALDTNWLDIAAALTIDPPRTTTIFKHSTDCSKARRFGRFGSYGFIYQSAWSDFGTNPSPSARSWPSAQ